LALWRREIDMTDIDLGWFVVSLDVKDIARSVAFYGKLGFKIVSGDIESRVVTIEKGNCRLALYQGYLDPPTTQLIFWQGDIDAIIGELGKEGIGWKPSTAKGPGKAAMLTDPDGHPIYLVNIPGVTLP
jgi:catechol 2,3-dioxygenase-like lactoylglutathione lyase family enzyme